MKNTRRMSCGCVISFPDVPEMTTLTFCPLHGAAPELLEACNLALAVAESLIHDEYDGTDMLAGMLAQLDPVRTAIAKAKGDQP